MTILAYVGVSVHLVLVNFIRVGGEYVIGRSMLDDSQLNTVTQRGGVELE